MSVSLSVTEHVSVSVHPLDMLNNFCFHVYSQKFIGENDNAFFGLYPSLSAWFPAKTINLLGVYLSAKSTWEYSLLSKFEAEHVKRKLVSEN